MVWPAIAAGAGVASAVTGISGASKARDQARKLAKANIAYDRLETKLNLRQMQKTAEKALGETKSRVYASNILMSGSAASYYNAMQSEFDQEMNWMQVQARQRQKVMKYGGQVAANNARSMGLQALFAGVGSAAQYLMPAAGVNPTAQTQVAAQPAAVPTVANPKITNANTNTSTSR